AHDWPTREFIVNATSEKMVEVAPLDFALQQVRTMNRWIWPLWLAGLVHLARRPERRALAIAYLAVFALLAASGSSRPGYLAPAYTWLFAAGGVAFETFFAKRGSRRLRWAVPALVLVLGAIRAPLALPLLAVDGYVEHARRLGVAPGTSEKKELALLPQQFADMHGWESIVATVERAWSSLTPDERKRAAVFASNYGEAGAVERLAVDPELREAVVSGHNNYWLWGARGKTGEVVIVVNSEEDDVREFFTRVEPAGRTACGHCMPYENDAPVWIGRLPRRSLADAWPALKHYD
ncbi:MAG: glycosyltransferase family 39 protein, partial [Myxococcota bacterium]